jgi:beta-glucosidase
VVQLYINDETSSVATYVKNLRDFKRITLDPGERKTVKFFLSENDLCLINKNNEKVVEPAVLKVMIGSSSEDSRLNGTFEII